MNKVQCWLLALSLAGAGTVATVPVANAERLPAPRQVVLRVTGSGVHAPDSLHAGRFRMEVRAPSRQPGIVLLVKPDRGYTIADLRADARASHRPGDAGNRRIRENIRFFGGAQVRPGGTAALWETLYAGRYWLVGFTFRGRTTFETVHVHGTPTPSRFPRVSASATTTDNALHFTRSVPQSGRMLIRHSGHGIEGLWMFPLVEGRTYDDFIRAVHHPRRGFPIRFQGGRSTASLSPDAGYVLRYRMRPGRYVAMDTHVLSAVFRGRRHIDNLRQSTRPLTVRPTGHHAVASGPSVQGLQRSQVVSPAPATTDGWLTPRARKLLEDSGLAAAVPGQAR